MLPFLQKSVESDKVLSMEELPINNNGGQGYGFILYQTEISQVPREISIDNVLDRAQVQTIFLIAVSQFFMLEKLQHKRNVQKLTLSCAISTFVDFTLFNARRFYLSMGNPFGRKELNRYRIISTQKLQP